ncbi:hypothetical protein LguiB_014040 [Lonicera macranthoides]
MVRLSPNVIGLADFCPPNVVFKCIDVYLLTFSGGMVRMSPNDIGLGGRSNVVGRWFRLEKYGRHKHKVHALVPKLCNVSDVSVWTASCSGKFSVLLRVLPVQKLIENVHESIVDVFSNAAISAKRSFQDDVLLHKLAGWIGVETNMKAEPCAIFFGIRRCHGEGKLNIVDLEMDSLTLLNILHERCLFLGL